LLTLSGFITAVAIQLLRLLVLVVGWFVWFFVCFVGLF